MHKYILWILLCSSISAISQNCNSSLMGSVIDLHDGSYLGGATIIVANTEQAVVTDFDGNFIITGLCDKTYVLQVAHPYCETTAFTVKIRGNTRKNLKLEHHLEELNQITVLGKAYGDKSNTIFENTISQDALEHFSSGALGDALNSLSGVSSLNSGNTVVKPMINGLHSSRVAIINNGVRMQDQEWGSEHAPNIDINSISNLTVIKGAGAIQYSGDAVGGVIVAEALKVPVKDSLCGKTLFTGASNGRGTSTATQLTKSYKNGWFGTVQGTLKRFGDFEAPDYVLSNTGVFERNISFNVGLNRFAYGFEAYYSLFKNEIGILRASHLGGIGDLCRAIESEEPLIVNDFTYDIDNPKQDVTHHLARIKGFKNFEGVGKLSLQYDYQLNERLEYDIRRGDDKYKPAMDLQLDTHNLMLDLDTHPNDDFGVKGGLVANYQKNFPDPNTGVRRLIPDYKKYGFGAFLISSWQINDAMLLEAGGRYDFTYMDVYKYYRTSFWESRNYDEEYSDIVIEEGRGQVLTHPELYFNNASATLGATYSLSEKYNLYFNYSLASRAPNPAELFSEGLHHSASRIELGDLGFHSEVGHKITMTLVRHHEKFRFSVQPFINSISDFIVLEPTGIDKTLRGSFQVWEYRQTDAQLFGVDVDASYDFANDFRFNHQFSLVKGYDRTMDTPLIHMPPANTTNEIVYQNHEYKNLRLSLQSVYVFRQNEYPDTNFEVYVPELGEIKEVDVSTPPDAYHLLNFHSSVELKVTNKSMLTLGVSVTNIMDTSYRNYLNRMRYYADDLGRNFLLNLKLNY